ncbi:MAG TPA: YihY/virulence factor BrkB family protein [Mycobacteriales bacterium]|jgi:membrane protein|nr:YihY/virulence factor BrkB family protein [Mycobacteriales bacterium]
MATTVPTSVPDGPLELSLRAWFSALKRTVVNVFASDLTDRAAALTYYGVLSIFPALLAAVSVIGLLGRSTSDKILHNVTDLAPGSVRDILTDAIRNLQGSGGAAGVLFVVGVLAAWWSASGYIAAFMRASNAIYRVGEGRPIWKTAPLRLVITSLAGIILLASALIVVLTGGLADHVGSALGLGSALVTAWAIAKWPVLILAIGLLFAVLYWASPNVKHGRFRWITPGSLLAVVMWVIVSGGFAVYVANFSSYNKTYGALATPIIFLTWLWLSNLAILVGAQFNAELERGREIAAGQPADQEPYLEPRDTTKLDGEPAPHRTAPR